MKRPKLRKTSKRMTCSKKYRIRKNVAAHNKKVKKLAKKGLGNPKHSKKDPGVPNSTPFKEEILHEAESRKQRAEEDKLRRKAARSEEMNKHRNLEGLQDDALKRQKEFNDKTSTIERMIVPQSMGRSEERSRKAYYKEFRKIVECSDVVVEVLDARDPLGCRCFAMENIVLQSGAKRIVLLLNKIDLVPKENVEAWLKYLRNQFPTVAFKASTQSQNNLTRHKASLKKIEQSVLSHTSQCVGADSLIKLLSNYCRHNGLETSITVGVVGFPNVGKSSVINSLKRTKACNVGAMPGVTKTVQEVSLNKNIKIVDCPGIVMATGINQSAVILRNCVKVETLADPITPVAAILDRCNKQQIMMRYNLSNYSDVNQFLDLLAHRKGKILKGGLPNIDAAAKSVIQDWNSGKISYFTHPPRKTGKIHVSAKIITSMAKEFDWDSLDSDNKQALLSIKGNPSQSRSILYRSVGPSEMDLEFESGKNENREGTDDEEDDFEEMEAAHEEVGDITINIKPNKPKTSKAVPPSASLSKSIDIQMEGPNIQANRDIKRLMKLKKKKQKRSDKLSDKLGESLLSSMNLTSEPSDDYDFDTDLQL